jgi:hypothetical protein
VSMPETPSNPYRPPQSFDDLALANRLSPDGGRPGGLSAVCAIAIVLGGMGLATSMMGLCAMAAKPWLNNVFVLPQQSAKADQFREAQREMQQRTEEVASRYAGFNLGFLLLNVLIGGSLFVGGILALRLSPKGRRLLLTAFTAAILLEILRAVVQSFAQIEMAEVMQGPMARMMQASASHGGPGTPENAAFTVVVSRAMYVGIAVWLAFAAAKVIFYAVGARYLHRPAIRQLFVKTGD